MTKAILFDLDCTLLPKVKPWNCVLIGNDIKEDYRAAA